MTSDTAEELIVMSTRCPWRRTPGSLKSWNICNSATAALSRILAERYGGDLGSTDAYHLGRLPGFTNRKNIYESNGNYPFTGLRGKVFRGVASGTAQLLIEAEKLAASMQSSPPYSLRGCAPTTSIPTNIDIDPSRSPMTETEAHEIYQAELKCQAERMGWKLPITKGLRSDADLRIVKSLHQYYGYAPDDLAALLMYESEKASQRGFKYVEWLVNVI